MRDKNDALSGTIFTAPSGSISKNDQTPEKGIDMGDTA